MANAAAWLRTQGANLDVVTQLDSRELSSEQISLIGQLQQQATPYVIRGVTVVVGGLGDGEVVGVAGVEVELVGGG